MSIINPLKKKLSVALIQLKTTANKEQNLRAVANQIQKAISARSNVDLVVLPECFNSPYSVKEFANYAEPIPNGETTKFLSKQAADHGIFIVGGSFPERGDDDKIYNTSLTFDRKGEIIAKHRKVHLFDIDIPGGITFKESVSLSAGNKATVFDSGEFGKVGIGICYDVRFPELAILAARKHNAGIMIYPGAFNTVTGPLHWELLARSRAVDNQIFVILCSPARDLDFSYHAYGHSLVVDPSGNVIAEAGEGEEIVYADLDPSLLESARAGIPVTTQRRYDIYPDISEASKVSAK
ncbi:BA75_03795T0 [Komagataella pastoris]|uniref:BA75_03795T0 n=1 Tax=Komagataella pastoris TaxID=4922 RepID=A0A1B2JFW0_PICPA|nr:BA75_03795T0 [Komagataella pastoris]